MSKKSKIIGWHCYLDYFNSETEALKGQIVDIDNNGVIIKADDKKHLCLG